MSLQLQPPVSSAGPVSAPGQTWARLDPWPGDRPELILAVVSGGMPTGWTPARDQGVAPNNYAWLISHKLAWLGVVHDVPSRGPGGGCSLQAQYAVVDAITGEQLIGGGSATAALDAWISRQPKLRSGWSFKALPTTTTAPPPPPSNIPTQPASP